MKYIEKELNHIKKLLELSFIDPVESKDLQNFVLGPSKRIRSALALYFLKSNQIELNENTYKILLAGELIHNASLLHDDVIDNAKMRRNCKTLGYKYDKNFAILAGDFILSIAIKNLLEINNSKVFEIFQNCVQKMTEAELKQLSLRNTTPKEEDYLEICKNKTALLFSAILNSCAFLHGLNEEIANKLGLNFGLAFQIKNDIEKTSRDEDINNGVKTAIDILGIEKTSNLLDNYKEELRKIIKTLPNSNYTIELEELINLL